MDKVAKYFLRTDSGGPWQKHNQRPRRWATTCRQNYHIMMTDGTWNGSGASSPPPMPMSMVRTVVMTAADGRTYQYKNDGVCI